MAGWFIVIIAVAYVTMLFAVASLGDRRPAAAARDTRESTFSEWRSYEASGTGGARRD